MAIIENTPQNLQEFRYMLDPSLTSKEVPDALIASRNILKSANRWVLAAVGMTEAEYDALAEDDERREIFEAVVIKHGAMDLIPIVAQLVSVNANGMMTRFQEIDWIKRRIQLYGDIEVELDSYRKSTSFYEAVSREKEVYGGK